MPSARKASIDPAAYERVESIRALIRTYGYLQLEKRRIRRGVTEMAQPRDAIAIAEFCGIRLDDWQKEALLTKEHDILLLVTRQGGKGEVASLLALDQMLNHPGSTTVVVSRGERQSKRLLRRIKRRYNQLANVPIAIVDSTVAFELANGSECIALPGTDETVRGIEAVDLLIIDEASLVPEALLTAVQPMTATTDGRTIAMATPRGKRGWFYEAWRSGEEDWHRAKVTWREIPRISPKWIARVRRRLGDAMFAQEFECEFIDDENQFFSSEIVDAALSDDVPIMSLGLGAA